MSPKDSIQITIIGTLPPIKGISEYCLQQTESLSNLCQINFINFHSIYPEFLYPGGETKEINWNYKFEKSESVKVSSIINWWNPISWIRAGFAISSKIVHLHWWSYILFPIFITIILIAKLTNKSVIVTAHNTKGHESNRVDFLSSKLIFNIADKVIVHADNNKEQLMDVFGICKDKIKVLPYGVLDSYLDKNISKKEALSKLNLSGDNQYILFFGTIREYKGLDDLLKAYNMVRKELDNVKLIIAGKNWENWNKYQRLIDDMDLSSKSILKLSFIPSNEVKYYFKAADLLVLPYKHFESQSGPGNIALAFDLPLLVTNVGGLPELTTIKNQVAKPGDPKDLGEKIINILEHKSLRIRIIKGSNLIKKKNNWSKIADETVKIYQEYAK